VQAEVLVSVQRVASCEPQVHNSQQAGTGI